jgi:hypothetical protein
MRYREHLHALKNCHKRKTLHFPIFLEKEEMFFSFGKEKCTDI